MMWQLLVVGVLGAVVGATELGARYRDDPAAALRTLPGVMYVTVNAAAAVAALVIVQAFGWTFGLARTASTLQVHVLQVLVAGLGSAALFRSSLFTVRQGSQEIGIGPSALLTGLLEQVEHGVDRQRALDRLRRDDLAGLSFDHDYVALTELCTGALQNPNKADAQALGELAARLKGEPDLSDADKLDCFALKLLTLVGPKAIRAAAERLRIRHSTESGDPDVTAPPAAAVPAEQAESWGEREAVLEWLVTHSADESRHLEAALELAWLDERLERYPSAAERYERLANAVGNMSPLLTDHELVIGWSNAEIALAESLLSLERPLESAALIFRDKAHDRLSGLLSQPGGQPGSYAAALYVLAQLPETSSYYALGYLTQALELVSAPIESPHADIKSLVHFARACHYLDDGNAEAAADDLMLASESPKRDLQIISASLGSLLLDNLPDDQAMALWRVIKPFGLVPRRAGMPQT